MSDRWHLTLNRYQRDNLLELFHACGYPAGGGNVPERALMGLHTGDWMGELYWQLAPPAGTEVDDVDPVRCLSLIQTLVVDGVGQLRPNLSAGDQVARVEQDASDPAYVRQLEDAVLGLFEWMGPHHPDIAELEYNAPRLAGFVRHLERDIPHEERMMRRNVWSEDGAPNDD